MESEDEEETCRCLMANPIDTERLVAEATEDEEEEEVSTTEFVKKECDYET
jgi:hypothetical protein